MEERARERRRLMQTTSNQPSWEALVKKLTMAAFRTPQLPSLLLESPKNLANLHCVSVSKTARTLNAQRQF